jgi:hypothetical protein
MTHAVHRNKLLWTMKPMMFLFGTIPAELFDTTQIFRGRAGATPMLYERESAKFVSGTFASTTTLQSRVGTRCGRASGAGNPLIPRGRRHTRWRIGGADSQAAWS